MKNKLFISILALSLLAGCSKSSEQHIVKTQNEVTATSQVAETPEPKEQTSHICNAPTKDGGKCKRRVSNEKGATAFCWMHQK